MFHDGKVEGEVNGNVVRDLRIDVMPVENQGNLSACLEWAYGKLEAALQSL
jgi:nicotinamide/nicotinate riboside kinase